MLYHKRVKNLFFGFQTEFVGRHYYNYMFSCSHYPIGSFVLGFGNIINYLPLFGVDAFQTHYFTEPFGAILSHNYY